MKIETSLSAGYQRDTWTIRDALRELISNALDGETRLKPLGLGKASLRYDGASQTVIVSNIGATVPTKALLMGTSESRDVDEAIGQFGEGLPMALLVLAREGRQVVIYNGEERWSATIERSSKFSGEHVLVVNTRKVTDRGRFEVHVSPISADQWTEAQRLFLAFDPSFDARLTVDAGRERIMLQPEFKGRIYCKGVFVTRRTDLLFGYEIDGKLNRDRSFLDEWDLKERLGKVLARASAESGSFCQQLVGLLFDNETSLESDHAYSDLVYREEVCEAAERRFIEEHGEDAIPLDGSSEEREAAALGIPGVRVGSTLYRILRDRRGSLASRRAKQQQQPSRVYAREELTTAEREHVQIVEALVQSALTVQPTIEIVTFNDLRTDFVRDGFTLRLPREGLLDLDKTLLRAVQCASSLMPSSANDQRDLALRMVSQLLHLDDNVLSLKLLVARAS